MTESLQTLSGEERQSVEKISARFEAAWEAGSEPSIDEYLPADKSVRQAALVELVHAELEYRLKAGQPGRVEQYLQRYPQLAEKSGTIVELVVAEYRQRQRREADLAAESFLERFPQQKEELSARLGELAAGEGANDSTGASAGATVSLGEKKRVETPTLTTPKQFGHYQLLGEIARGGMGVVYRARDEKLNRVVALKMMLSGSHASAEEAERFQVEAEAVAKLGHPNIVQIYEVGEKEGQAYISLEYIDGGSLDEKIGQTAQGVLESARLVETLAEAMQLAHANEIIHRDLKPANILLTVDGDPKITDFGLAKRMDDDSARTKSGTVIGTPSYMAPEQACGNTDTLSTATDVYSLGAILYHMLVGRPPFQADSQLDTLLQVVSDEPVAPRRLNERISRDLETITLKCLRKAPSQRYANGGELAVELGRFLAGEPIRARAVSQLERGWKWCRRRPAVAGLWAFALILLFTLGIGIPVSLNREAKRQLESEKDAAALIADKADQDLKLKQAELNRAQESARFLEKEYAFSVAIPFFEKIGKLTEEVYGAEHQLHIAALNQLAHVYGEVGRFDDLVEVRQQIRDALGDPAKTGDQADPLVAMNNLAYAFEMAGRFEESKKLYQSTLRLIQADSRAHEHLALITENNLAVCLWAMGEVNEAVSLLEGNIQRRRKYLEAGKQGALSFLLKPIQKFECILLFIRQTFWARRKR